MKIYFNPVSVTSRSLMLFIADHKLDVEMKVVDLMKGEHHQPDYVALNPNRLVPVLDDDGFILTESAAILKYLADKVDSPKYPKDLKARARVNERMDWLNTQFFREYGYHLIYPQIFPNHIREAETTQKDTLEWGKKHSATVLQILNDHLLKDSKFLAGNELTIADYLGACMVTAGDHIRADLSPYPQVSAWLARVKEGSDWASVNQAHDGLAAALKEKPFETI